MGVFRRYAGPFFLEIKAEADFNGFTMGAGAGIKILCSDRLYLKVGYEFNRTFVSDDVGINVNQHLITVGLGTQF